MAKCAKWVVDKGTRCPNEAMETNIYCKFHFSEMVSLQSKKGGQQQQQQQQSQQSQQQQQQ